MSRNKTHNKEKSKIDKQISISVLLPLPFDKTFTYLATSDLNLKIGDFVKVPFGNKLAAKPSPITPSITSSKELIILYNELIFSLSNNTKSIDSHEGH